MAGDITIYIHKRVQAHTHTHGIDGRVALVIIIMNTGTEQHQHHHHYHHYHEYAKGKASFATMDKYDIRDDFKAAVLAVTYTKQMYRQLSVTLNSVEITFYRELLQQISKSEIRNFRLPFNIAEIFSN